MDQIRMAAVDGYLCVPHGGVETGGILFGTHDCGVVRILAWRPIVCEYAKGPSFVLSAKDEAALAEALRSSQSDPELAGLEPAGWYHSHTRSEIFLSDVDLDLFQRFFPKPWQVALVVRPASFAPSRAGFFIREPDGSVQAHSSYREFQLTTVRAAGPGAAEGPATASERSTALVESEPQPVEVEPEIPVPVERETPVKAASSARWKWYGAGLILILMAAAAALLFWQFQPTRLGFLLSTTDAGGQLRIVWDRSAPSIRKATRGSLAIEDRGVQTEVKLTAAELRSGSIAYARQSGDVVVRLTVELPKGVTVDEVTHFLSPGESSMAPAAQPPTRNQELQRETEAMRAHIEQQKTELARLQQLVETLHRSSPGAAPPKNSAAAPVPSTVPWKPSQPVKPPESQATARPTTSAPLAISQSAPNKPAPPLKPPESQATAQSMTSSSAAENKPTPPLKPPESQAAAQPKTGAPAPAPSAAENKPAPPLKPPESQATARLTANIAPPKIDSSPAPPQAAAVTRLSAPPPAAPPAFTSAAPRPTTATSAASGRFIWTGKLLKSSRLVIEGGRASSGVLNGALPPGAARVNAYPGDLTAQGMTLFTPDSRYAHPKTEAAGAQNGWNRTTYTLDVKRAGAIRIVEQPGPQNGYKLVLQSEAAKVSVVVIEWRATQ
jgi:proteasome lid subunit RPN8/RPN11